MLIRIRRHFSRKKAQSSLEYITLFSVIVAAIIIGQAFLKRRAQGYIKEQSGQLSNEGWSFSNSQEHYKEKLLGDQTITEKINTDDLENNVYSKVERTGGESRAQRNTKTDALSQETYSFDKYDDTTYDDFTLENSWK